MENCNPAGNAVEPSSKIKEILNDFVSRRFGPFNFHIGYI